MHHHQQLAVLACINQLVLTIWQSVPSTYLSFLEVSERSHPLASLSQLKSAKIQQRAGKYPKHLLSQQHYPSSSLPYNFTKA
jgi:hypothetical protein